MLRHRGSFELEVSTREYGVDVLGWPVVCLFLFGSATCALELAMMARVLEFLSMSGSRPPEDLVESQAGCPCGAQIVDTAACRELSQLSAPYR